MRDSAVRNKVVPNELWVPISWTNAGSVNDFTLGWWLCNGALTAGNSGILFVDENQEVFNTTKHCSVNGYMVYNRFRDHLQTLSYLYTINMFS